MENYHWILLIIFSIPAFGIKIYNEYRYSQNIYWVGMNKAEIILFTLPMILMNLTIRKYHVTDLNYFSYFVAVMLSFIHSIKRYKDVRYIVAEAEIEKEEKIKAIKAKEKIEYNDRDKGDVCSWSPSGGGGGSGYTPTENINYTGSTFINYNSNTLNTIDALEAERRKNFELARNWVGIVSPDVSINSNLYNPINTSMETKRITMTEDQRRRMIVYYDNDESPLMRGMVYEFDGVKIKIIDSTNQCYFWQQDKECWTLICFDETFMKFLETGEID